MKNFRKELLFEIPRRRQFVNITPQIAECVRASGVREGLALVNAMHISASVFINDDEAGLHHDLEVWLAKQGGNQSQIELHGDAALTLRQPMPTT